MREQANLGHSPRVERELEALFSIPAPDAAFVARLERQLVAQGISQFEKDNAKASPPWVQLLGRRRWAAVALGLLLVLAVAVIAIGKQLACSHADFKRNFRCHGMRVRRPANAVSAK